MPATLVVIPRPTKLANGIAAVTKINGTCLKSAAHSSTDYFTTVDNLNKSRAATIPNTPLITYPNSRTKCADWVEYTTRDLNASADEAAKEFDKLGLTPKLALTTTLH
ncbi:hypothetical protein PspLS_11819 [Pyricularia sp. CBS 133598]|nr:hypothetical protein PspLS_11819 [Pyricularia sp. CBS 133598]